MSMKSTTREHLAAAVTIVVLLGFAADAQAEGASGAHRRVTAHHDTPRWHTGSPSVTRSSTTDTGAATSSDAGTRYDTG